MSLGIEEMEEWDAREHQLGEYLAFSAGRYILLRGKYRGAFLDTVPRGYLRNYVLNKWRDSFNEEEEQLFEQYAKKGHDEAAGSGAEGNR